MKRMLITALAALLTVSAFASRPDDDPLYASPNGTFTFDLVSHIGYGYHFVKSSAFKPSSAGEFFVNIFEFGLYPGKHFGIELGVDIESNYFRSKEHFFVLDTKDKIQAVKISESSLGGSYEKARGSFNFLTFNAPLMLKGYFDKFQIGVGAEASLNCLGETYMTYKTGSKRTQVEDTAADINLFSYGIIASLGFDYTSIFFKYYPKGSKVLPDGSVDLNYMTLGIALGF